MKLLQTLLLILLINSIILAQDKSDWVYEYPDGCTTITVGKKASFDGSVMTSHTDDSHRTRSWVNIIPAKNHKKGSTTDVFKRVASNEFAMPTYAHKKIGEIPQVEHTFGYINTAYPCMNEKQLAIGESTFGGRSELQSDKGIIDCQRLIKFMLERTSTAREAIALADELTKKYGWNDAGECLTIADKKEVWHFEIVGPGKNKIGAVWVAQRVPDNHVAVNANASTIKEIDLKNKDYFMASANVFDVAKENGYWNPKTEKFRFCYAYAPKSRLSVAARRREWRVFDLLAPSLKLSPTSENYPFSVKPDTLVTIEKMISVFQDYYQGTPYDLRRNITTKDKDGKQIISPLANPFMPYDELSLHNVNGGWYHVDKKTNHISFLGERTIARWYTMYGTIIQTRDWLPDDIGGLVWLAQDNIATSVYIPVYCGATDLDKSYKTPGRTNGFTYESAWWAFNRLGTLTAQRWGDISQDVRKEFDKMQNDIFTEQTKFEKEISVEKNSKKRQEKITEFTKKWGKTAVKKAWDLGNFIWTKYDEKF